MRIYKRGNTWWSSWTEDGVTVKRSTRCTTKDAARIVAERWERERADPSHAAANKALLEDEVKRWLTTCELAGKSAGTMNEYRCKTGHLVRLLPERLTKITPVVVDAYFDTRRSEGASLSTMNKEWKKLRMILRAAERRGLWRGSLETLKPEWVREHYVPRKRRLTWDELRKLLAELKGSHLATVAFIVATGARWGEAMRARPEDIQPGHVLLRGTKTKTGHRTVPNAEVFRWLLDIVRVSHVDGPCGPDGLLFARWPGVHKSLQWACARARIDVVSPNDLRRTFASLLSDAGASNQVVAKLMGHTSTSMVDRVYNRPTTESLGALLERQTGVPAVSHGTDNSEKEKKE